MDLQRFQKEPLWQPHKNSGHTMKRFMKAVSERHNQDFCDYWEFHKWSVDNIGDFWAVVWDFFGIIYSKKYDQVIDTKISMEDAPKWFEGARLNFAENLLKYRDDRIALLITGENRNVEKVTYKQLYEETKVYAAALKKLGLKKGDRVACYMSNRKEPVIAMLAVTSIGGIWTGGLPTLGPQAFLNRVKQVNPKILFTVDQFPQNKELYHLLPNIKEIVDGLSSLIKVIIVPATSESKRKDIRHIKNSCFLDDFLASGHNPDGSVPDLTFEQVSFSHPVFINYTSGTTGLPKTIVHGFGGLLTGIRDYCLHYDTHEGETWLSISPVGWVSWNFMNHTLFAGYTLALFEGLPYFLSPTYLWDLIDDLKLSRLFVGSGDFEEMEAKGYVPSEQHHLSSLKLVQLGGSIVKPHCYEFANKILKAPAKLAVGCGSTEMMGFALITDSTLPIYKGEISAPCLGIQLEILDDEGNQLTGEMGEFTVSQPVPSLPLGLWGDANGELFKKAYFSKYKGKFTIGDTAIINPVTKGIIMCGRSDETLKPRGCRFGSSEIYNIVKYFPEIRDSICVSQYGKDMDERAVLFIRMQENEQLSPDLIQRLKKKITDELTKYHVPAVILEVPEIPYNDNRKKMEIIVKKIINRMPHNPETVSNSDCLKYYYDIPELQGY